MGAAARRKGHQFERDTANILKSIFPNARRQLEYHAEDAKGVDIQNTGQYRFQCKKFKDYVPISKINEIQISKFDRECGIVPVLITAGDNKEPMAVLPFDCLLNLIKVNELNLKDV